MPRPLTLSVELLRTFVMVVRSKGDAMEVARQLKINQPSMSKRLKALQTPGPLLSKPWLRREGKTWLLTEEGDKVLPAVEELLQRYDQLLTFTHPCEAQTSVSFGCGRQFATSVGLEASNQFRKEFPDVRLHISTLRGNQRVEGVANGSLDLAAVTHTDAEVKNLARRRLYSKRLTEDRLVLAWAKDLKADWKDRVAALPATKVSHTKLPGIPLILPERDAFIRQAFDDVLYEKDKLGEIDVVLEIGGWSTILEYVRRGVGVGVVTESAVAGEKNLVVRPLATGKNEFQPVQIRLIARLRNQQTNEPDLSPEALRFHDLLLKAAKGK